MTRLGIGVAVLVAVTAISVAAAGPMAAKQRVAIVSYGAEAIRTRPGSCLRHCVRELSGATRGPEALS
jgi:hypothetical protein